MSRQVWALVILAFSSCATAQTASQLAEVDKQTITVRFLGQPPDKSQLYVCGFVHDVFSCVPYTEFQKALNAP